MDELTLDYVATPDQARDVAQFLRTYRTRRQLSVVIDDHLDPDMPSMPCARLWD
ncbi:hypothetical protein ACTD5D_22655 [Nocardia takedensis]|uniref:hypothetical protein n=1 Tax=Nocardia takedensis TaxID=259390 RepID=UPI003F769435